MNERKPFSIDLPALTAKQSQSLIFQCSDAVLFLSAEMTVMDVASSGDFDPLVLQGWEGAHLKDIIAEDSQTKIGALLNDNSVFSLDDGRWRHLNFTSGGDADLPLLVKFFRFVHEGTATHLICARDLRPLSNAQRKWQKQQNAMQQSYEDQLAILQERPDIDLLLNDMTKRVGTLPLNELVAQALNYVERLCCTEALDRSDGKVEEAAEMLGLSAGTFLARLHQD